MIGAKGRGRLPKGGELRNCVNQEFLHRRQYVDRHRQHHSEWGKDRERLIGAHAFIPEKKEIPDNSMVGLFQQENVNSHRILSKHLLTRELQGF
jgi:hypothetical protein